jgi:hypothetical protein
MTARTVVESISGATLAISATLPASYDAAGYNETNIVYTLVGEVENYGNHGVTAAISEFTPVDTAVTAKIKGAKNYGNMALMLGYRPGDAGQALIAAAAESNAHYSVRIVYPDGERHYMDVLVHKCENQDGAVNDVQKLSVELAICRKPVVVLP